MIKKGADVNAVDGRKNTPLMFVENGEIARLLLANGANPNARNINGDSPLFNARNAEVAVALLENGATVNLKNNNGDTALIHYAKRFNGARPVLTADTFVKIWKSLKVHGVDALETNHENKRARDYLNSDDKEQKRVAVRLVHYEANQRINKAAALRKSAQAGESK